MVAALIASYCDIRLCVIAHLSVRAVCLRVAAALREDLSEDGSIEELRHGFRSREPSACGRLSTPM